MKSILLLTACILFTFIFIDCSNEATPADKEEVINVMNKNLKAMQDEDFNAVTETIYSGSPNYNLSISMIKNIFEQYDLCYELKSYNIDKIDGDEAQISFEQVTTKISGPAFKNNKLTGTHLFRKENGAWKIFSTKIKNIEYLN